MQMKTTLRFYSLLIGKKVLNKNTSRWQEFNDMDSLIMLAGVNGNCHDPLGKRILFNAVHSTS